MSLQKFEQELEVIESKFQKKFDEQKSKFETESQKQQTEFRNLHLRQENEFTDIIENLKKDTIQKLFNQTKKEKPVGTFTLDKNIDPKLYAAFDKKPYFMIPGQKKNTVYVIVPKFIKKFQVGWLKDELDEYYRYEVNQYGIFFGDVPKEILDEIKMPEPIKANVSGNKINFIADDQKNIKRELFRYVKDWTATDATITKGHEFDIISQILESGHVPFDKTPVEKPDLISGPKNILLREYQITAWNNFLKTGASGIFHPTGSGKSFIGMAALESIRVGNRRNLIISPRTTLVEQWKYYLEKNIPDALENTLITTYQGFKNFQEDFGFTIYDECQALPAHNFSKLATINTKYRMGLSATPFREDGKNHLIITLTGHPESLNWPEYMRKYGPGYHQINVHIVSNQRTKLLKAYSLYKPKKRTMFYSYGLDIGGIIAEKYQIPHIHGDTENRMDVMNSSHSFVASSVFTEGISIQDLDHIIEVDFHYGSRREELQLTGRLMHSKQENKIHDIIMTEGEFDSYKKRILVLEEKGFHVKIMENEN